MILMGIFFTVANFVAFGFCRTLPQAIAVQMLLGAGNGNQGDKTWRDGDGRLELTSLTC